MSKLLNHLGSLSLLPRGDYEYVILPFDFGFDPDFLATSCSLMLEKWSSLPSRPKIKKILTIESKGIPLATLLALKLGVPVSIARKRCYGVEDEVKIVKRTGYEESIVYLNDMRPGEKGVLLVDDIISTGGTLASILGWTEEASVEIADIWILFEKEYPDPEKSGRTKIKNRFGKDIRCLIQLVKDERGNYKAVASRD
ncbi:MAG: phosphoribosyltransferase family protein [Promethearchaeota archaeon]